MKIITQRSQILDVIENWKSKSPTYRSSEYGKKILKGLQELDLRTATIEDLISVIKAESRYLRPQICSECKKYCEVLIHVGEEMDYESETAYLCKECLEKAFNLAKKALYE